MSSVITARVPKELKEDLSRYDVEVSRVVRKALEEEIRKKKLEERKRIAKELGEFFANISEDEIIASVRQIRGER